VRAPPLSLRQDPSKIPGRPGAVPARRGAISKGCAIGAGVVVLIVLVPVMLLWSGYNGLVGSQEDASQRWAQVENQYKRRYELIPNLVETVKGVADFEQSTLQAVTDARASVGRVQLPSDLPTDQESLNAYVRAQQGLGSALGRLFAVSENYPQLRATESFLDLQSQLEGTENRIAVAREDYTRAVAAYNKKVRRFPSNLVAALTGFEVLPQFTVPEEETAVPQVDFGK
jgi:LemA protein